MQDQNWARGIPGSPPLQHVLLFPVFRHLSASCQGTMQHVRPSRPSDSVDVDGRVDPVTPTPFISVNILPSDPMSPDGGGDLIFFPPKTRTHAVMHPTGPPPGGPDTRGQRRQTSTPSGDLRRVDWTWTASDGARDVATSKVDSRSFVISIFNEKEYIVLVLIYNGLEQ